MQVAGRLHVATSARASVAAWACCLLGILASGAQGAATAAAPAALPASAQSPTKMPAPVPVPDTIEQRVAACTTCHGRQGRAARDGYYPRIAGKPAGYLYNQLINFREGRRHYAPMTYLVEHLSES